MDLDKFCQSEETLTYYLFSRRTLDTGESLASYLSDLKF